MVQVGTRTGVIGTLYGVVEGLLCGDGAAIGQATTGTMTWVTTKVTHYTYSHSTVYRIKVK